MRHRLEARAHCLEVGAVDARDAGRPGAPRSLDDRVDLVGEEQHVPTQLVGRDDPLDGDDDPLGGAGEGLVGVEEEVARARREDVPLLVGGLGVEDADVGPQGPGGEKALARVGARDLGDPELRDEVGAARAAGGEEG